jgi:hypothetical protein
MKAEQHLSLFFFFMVKIIRNCFDKTFNLKGFKFFERELEPKVGKKFRSFKEIITN